MRISGRLVLLLAIPLVALVGITGYGVSYGASRAGEASRLEDRSELGSLAHELVADLQRERTRLIAQDATTEELRNSIEAAGAEIDSRSAAIGGDVRSAAARVERRLDGIAHVADAGLGGQVALRTYSLAVGELLDLATISTDPRGAIDDAAASTVDYLARARAASAEEHDLLVFLSGGGSLGTDAFQQLTALASAQERYAELASSSAPSNLAIRIDRVGHAMRAADTIRRDAFAAFGSGRDLEWREGLAERTEELARLQADAARIADAAVAELAASSRVLLVTAFLSAVAILLVSAFLLRRAVRTIARPLQDLAAQAEDVARSRLPEAVRAQQEHGGEELHLPALRVTGAAEVHEVATAFNDIQDTALRLAGEQAALRLNQAEAMTNLGRRNQTLLARQLDFISSLESRETDPAFLEHLFKLDHLASRMRRNAESLLILAGSETPRRRRTPAQVTEVVRAAMSEVEEFERVRIGHLRDATIAGPAVIDLVHLLAELIENALGFSPPESTVEIDGRSLGQGGYQFAVIDHGVGMSDLELLAANQRMSGKDELEGMPTRYLGQYVVAKLASKLGALVRLQPSAGGRGVTATINLPTTAVMGAPDRSDVAAPRPGSRAAREQGPVPFAPGAGVSEAARSVVVDTGAVDSELVDAAAVDQGRSGSDDAPTELVGSGSFESFGSGSFETGSVEPEPFEAGPFETGSFETGSFETGPFEAEPVESGLFAPDLFSTSPYDAAEFDDPPIDAPIAEAEWFTSTDPTHAPFEAPLSAPVDAAPVDAAPVPPPVPDEVPAQPDWSPRQLSAVAPREGTASAGPSRAGGLARRVPGASLAEREGGAVGVATDPPPDRSADEVRSMLSSFQAGRHRGRGGEVTHEHVPVVDAAAAGAADDHETNDWRSDT